MSQILEPDDPLETLDERYIPILRDYLYDRPNEVAPLAAAQAIDNAILDGKAEDELWTFWGVVIAVVSYIPADEDAERRHRRLVDLVRQLRGLSSGTVSIWGNTQRLWEDLPLMGPVLRERWQEPSDANWTESISREWNNKNMFLAMLLNSNIISDLDKFMNFPIWTLRGALEEDLYESKPFAKARIAAAAQWMKYASEVLLRESRSGQQEAYRGVTAPGELFSGLAGLSKERLKFWKRRFGEIAGRAQDERIRVVAGEAEGMVKVE